MWKHLNLIVYLDLFQIFKQIPVFFWVLTYKNTFRNQSEFNLISENYLLSLLNYIVYINSIISVILSLSVSTVIEFSINVRVRDLTVDVHLQHFVQTDWQDDCIPAPWKAGWTAAAHSLWIKAAGGHTSQISQMIKALNTHWYVTMVFNFTS